MPQFCFAAASDEIRESLPFVAAQRIPFHEPLHHLGNALGRNGHNRHAVGTGVMGPLAAEHHLEMWHRIPGDLPAYPIEPNVRHVMLPAAIEAAADLDMQVLDGFVELKAF